MNEHRQDVQLSRSNSNASASSSLTSLDTVVLVTPPVQPARVQELSPQPPSRAHSLPSSTSNSSGKTVSTSSSTNSHTTSSNSAISSNASSYSTSTSATSNSASYSSSHNSSSCLSISTSQSSSLSSPSSSPVSRMPRKLCGSSKRRRNSGSIAAPVRREEPAVEQSEGEGERCECCCYCSWQSVAPEPVVLVSCGSFNPITTMHLRMMELARDAVEKTWSFHQSPPQVEVQPGQSKAHASTSAAGTGADKPPFSTSSLLNPRRQTVVAGIISPVSDGYAKAGLASAESRCRLARLACSTTSDWLAVDSWEASQPQWTPTRRVLERIQSRLHLIIRRLDAETGGSGVDAGLSKEGDSDHLEDPRFGEATGSQEESLSTSGSATNAWLLAHLLSVREAEAKAMATSQGRTGGQCCCNRKRPISATSVLPPVRVKLVCGADLLESFATPNLWSEGDMTALVRDYGIVCISRPGSNAARLLYEMDLLSQYEQNVILATELSQNGLSATVVRRALARGQSVRYLVPDAALEEIYARGLYGAAKPSHPSLLLFVPPSPPPTTLLSVQTAPMAPPPPSTEPSKAEEVEGEAIGHRQPQHPSTCLTEDTKVMGPLSEPLISTSEKGTNPLYIETRSHYVQTRLSSLPSPQAPGTMTTSATSGTGGGDAPLILHRVIVDPSVEKGVPEGGLTAILPLLKQCTRCGSQRVRLLLVERPPAPSQTLPAPPSVPRTPVVYTPRIHRQNRRHHHHHGDRRHGTMTLSKMGEVKKEERRILHLERHMGQQRPMLSVRSMTQPITLPGALSREKPQRGAEAAATKILERTRGETSDQPCAHHHHISLQIPKSMLHPLSQRHQHYHRRPSDGLSSVSRGRSLPRDLQSSLTSRQQPSRHSHERHHHRHRQPLELIKSSSQETPTSSSQRMTPVTPKSFQSGPVKKRTRRRERQRVGPPQPRFEGDGAAAPPSSSLRRGTVVCLPHPHAQLRPRHLSPPTVESQPIPPVLLVPRSRRSPIAATNYTSIRPSTTPISLSQPMLTQTSNAGRPLRRTYDEVDYLLYNLCLNIESAL